MNKKSSRGVVCLFLVAGFFVAAPSSQRPPLNPSTSALLIRAEQTSSSDDMDLNLEADKGNICSGVPDYAKGITAEPSLAGKVSHKPEFEKNLKSAVLSLIRYPWQDLGYDIAFMGSRPGYRAMTLTGRRRIEIYVRPGEAVLNQAFDLAHELGHAFDLKYNDEERRRKWREMRGIKSSVPWFGCDACPDYRTPAGDFAETFAFLLLGPGNYHSLIAPLPPMAQVEELAKFCGIDRMSDYLATRLPRKADPITFRTAKTEKRAAQKEKPESLAEVAVQQENTLPAPAPDSFEEKVLAVAVPDEKPEAVEDSKPESAIEMQAPKADEPVLAPDTPSIPGSNETPSI